MSILPEKSTAFSVDNVRVTKILGAGLFSSLVVQGMVFRREAEGTINTAEKAKVAVFTCPIDIAATETKVTHARTHAHTHALVSGADAAVF